MFTQETDENIRVGKIGEDHAHDYLRSKGYSVLDRNYRRKYGEIDIVAKGPDKTLVFVEVKTLAGQPFGLQPEDNLSSSKLAKLKKICEQYANANLNHIKERGWRIDLVAVSIKDDKKTTFRHYENIA